MNKKTNKSWYVCGSYSQGSLNRNKGIYSNPSMTKKGMDSLFELNQIKIKMYNYLHLRVAENMTKQPFLR